MIHILPSSTFEGVATLTTDISSDSRGDFRELFRASDFRELGIEGDFVQDNLSVSKKGALRGLHFQKTQPQAKCIFPIRGKIYDTIVDLRKGSLTFGRAEGFLLEDGKGLFVPKGFAHGFLALEDETMVFYKCDAYYRNEDERGILWNDPSLGIEWQRIMQTYGIDAPIISEKDKKLPYFSQIEENLSST